MTKPPDSESHTAKHPLCIIGEADLFIARLLRRYAVTCGLQPVCAQTGEDVLAWAAAGGSGPARPVLVVLDPELPGKMRGFEVAQLLRAGCEQAGSRAVIPIILCTWLGEADAYALVGQVVPYLQKPDVHYDDFVAALKRAEVPSDAPPPDVRRAP